MRTGLPLVKENTCITRETSERLSGNVRREKANSGGKLSGPTSTQDFFSDRGRGKSPPIKEPVGLPRKGFVGKDTGRKNMDAGGNLRLPD